MQGDRMLISIDAVDHETAEDTNVKMMNSGIAIVVPVGKIKEVLNHPGSIADRKRITQQLEDQTLIVKELGHGNWRSSRH
jgi:hypothetical protein